MVRCGELCKSCVGRCRESVSQKFPAEIECPVCGGEGGWMHEGKQVVCEHCNDGYYCLTECPSKYIGQELISDIQVVSACEHHLPVAGGLLDQSAWWFELRGLLKSEEAKIQDEQAKRRE